jgi:hypothetical protein
VTLWAIYSDQHAEVDVGGDRAGLLGLATALARGITDDLNLDAPPPSWQTAPVLRAIPVKPNETPDSLIRFYRRCFDHATAQPSTCRNVTCSMCGSRPASAT